MAGTAEEVARLKPITRRLREHVIRMITAAGSGHPGGSLSAAEIVTVLFFHTLRRRQGDPTWSERDRFVISKGHGVPIVYAALAEAGELPVAELATLRKLGSRLQGHPDRVAPPWVEAGRGGGPWLLIAHTVKGKGVSFMEGKSAWHGKAPTAEEAARALEEIARHG